MIPRAALAALAAALIGAGCGGDEASAPTISVAATPATTTTTSSPAPSSTTTGDAPGEAAGTDEGGAAGADEGATAPGDGAGAAAPAGGDEPTPSEVRDYLERQRETIDRIREAAGRARNGDPNALAELRRELKPTAAERRRMRSALEQLCADPDAPERICDRVP